MGSGIKEKGRRIMSCCRDCDRCKRESCGLLVITVLSFIIGLAGSVLGSIMYRAGNIEVVPLLCFVGLLLLSVCGPFWWRIIWKWEDILHGRKDDV